MKRQLTILFLCTALFAKAQINQAFYHGIVANVSYDTVLYNLQKLQDFGVKQPGTTALNNTKNWLVGKYQQYGYSNIVSNNFTYGSNTLTNIVVTKTGELYPNTFLIVDGHYDTKTGTGTNDNGSGIAIILEIARLLANVNTQFSIKFINFSAEESGLIGSSDYVSNISTPQNLDIRLVFNIDEVGGVAGQTNNTVSCESDQSAPTANNAVSALFTDTLAQATAVYSSLSTIITNAYGSDYVPFQQAGEIITGFYETNESTYVHGSGDNLAHLDTSYVVEIAKASTGATLFLARAFDVYTATRIEAQKLSLNVFPNPFRDQFTIENTSNQIYTYIIYGIDGKKICSQQILPATQTISNMTDLSAGFYILNVMDERGGVLERMKLVKGR